jgi:hypothetical protein
VLKTYTKYNNSKIRQNDIQDQKKVVFVLNLALTLIGGLEDYQLEFKTLGSGAEVFKQ